ncbi:MAG TPA: Rieske 2Fe-2S domain-containing protein, partial [Acetobacteraceae bacterium]
MGAADSSDKGIDFIRGVAIASLADGAMLQGHVGEEAALLVRRGADLFAIGATCTHYGGPLAEGLVVGETIRCPWHHACFSLRSGEMLRPPALNAVPCWRVEQRDGTAFVRERLDPTKRTLPGTGLPDSIVIIGAGAAGNMAAETLRQEGYAGPITVLGADPAPPCDRPNLSKDYLAGTAEADWIPLR